MRGAYDARRYWQDRAERAGPAYVGPGADPHFTERQVATFLPVLDSLIEGRRYGCVLDFGCGSGRFTPFLAGRAERYVGVDISRAGIDHALGRLEEEPLEGVEFHYLAEDRLPLEADGVDLLVAVTVFQHVVYDLEWRTWARELNRVLGHPSQAVVIDAAPHPSPAKHMRARTADEVAAALGMRKVTELRMPRHWAALMERRR